MPISRSPIRPAKCLRMPGQIAPGLNSLASAAKDRSAHRIAQAFDLCRIGGISEAFGEVEEFLLLTPLSRHPVLDEFQQHPVGAKPARFLQAPNLHADGRRQRIALPYRFVGCGHNTIMQNGAGTGDSVPNRFGGSVQDNVVGLSWTQFLCGCWIQGERACGAFEAEDFFRSRE